MFMRTNLVVAVSILMGANLAVASVSVPLRHGAYVNRDVPCGVASNSTLMWFNGRFFSAGRMPNVMVSRAATKGGSYVGYYQDETGQRVSQTYTVKGRNEFVLTTPFGKSVMRYCPDSTLPSIWRGRTPL